MARKTATVVISEEGRDKGKHFEITEMSAVQGEKFAIRVIQALIAGGVEIDMSNASAATLASIGFAAFSKIPLADIEDLSAQLMACVKWQNPTNHSITRNIIEEDIEEISTLLTLKKESFMLNFGFFLSALSRGSV